MKYRYNKERGWMETCWDDGSRTETLGVLGPEGWLWVRGDEHDRQIEHLKDMLALGEQRDIRLRGCASYIEYLEGLLKENGIAIPPRQRGEAFDKNAGGGI